MKTVLSSKVLKVSGSYLTVRRVYKRAISEILIFFLSHLLGVPLSPKPDSLFGITRCFWDLQKVSRHGTCALQV